MLRGIRKMVDENSIYNIVEHNSSVVYNKHDIVAVFERFSEFSVPKSVKYYYSLTDNNRDNTPAADSSFWGGVTSFSDTTKSKFVWAPSYNTQVEHKPRVNSIVFSNGYEQRLQDGIFNDLLRINLKFEHRDIREARAINHFLQSRKGVESFIFHDLPEPHNDMISAGYRKMFICKQWTSDFVFYNNYTISAEFQQTNT